MCQKTVGKGRVSNLQLGKMSIIGIPFSRAAIDLIGPIHRSQADNGHRFVILVVDYATRYPEAKLLKNVDTETMAAALVENFSMVGIPKEILTDQSKQST